MGSGASHDITAFLRAWRQGDQGALESLIPLVDQELRRVARRCLQGKRGDPMLETTALVNEAYLRLIGASQASWQDRAHRTAKRGGGKPAISLDEGLVAIALLRELGGAEAL
ncbi:MAG: ECF-type sigma factor [Acidobacteriota bacterium]